MLFNQSLIHDKNYIYTISFFLPKTQFISTRDTVHFRPKTLFISAPNTSACKGTDIFLNMQG